MWRRTCLCINFITEDSHHADDVICMQSVGKTLNNFVLNIN